MKGFAADQVVFFLGALLVVGVALGVTVTRATSPFETQGRLSSDTRFISKIDTNAQKVCNDPGLERMPRNTSKYMTYSFQGLKEGRLSSEGDAIVLDYGDGKRRRVALSDVCDSYQMQAFGSGIQKFYIQETSNGARIGVK